MYKFYKGFSTRNYAKSGGGFDIYNVDVITEDIMNELFTMKGERLKMPDFGTRIPMMVMEFNDEDTIEALKDDVKGVIDRDPRVQLQALDVVSDADRHSVAMVAKVLYKEFLVTRDLYIQVNNR